MRCDDFSITKCTLQRQLIRHPGLHKTLRLLLIGRLVGKLLKIKNVSDVYFRSAQLFGQPLDFYFNTSVFQPPYSGSQLLPHKRRAMTTFDGGVKNLLAVNFIQRRDFVLSIRRERPFFFFFFHPMYYLSYSVFLPP